MPIVSPDFHFERLIAPVPFDTFLRDFYERRTLVLRRGYPDYHNRLLSLEDLDDFLAVRPPRGGRVNVLDARREIKPEDYLLVDGRVDVVRLWQLFDEGATLNFCQMQECVPSLAGICCAAEQLFGCPFQTNVYLTPPNSQGFKTHHDTHDVIVLQVAGSKQWRLYEPTIAFPLPDQTLNEKAEVGPVTEEFTLDAGDTFYCPRGIPHDAESTDQLSLHITFGVLSFTWAELMIETLAELCLRDAEFRRSLPVGFAATRESSSGLTPHFRVLAARFLENAKVDAAFDGMLERFLSNRRAITTHQRAHVRAAGSITPDSYLGGRPGLLYRWTSEDEIARLQCGASEIAFPLRVMDSVTFALETRRYRVGDIPSGLDDQGKLVLARRLIREGLVVIHDLSQMRA